MLVSFYKYGRVDHGNPIREFLNNDDDSNPELIDPLCDGLSRLLFNASQDDLKEAEKLELPTTQSEILNLRNERLAGTLSLLDDLYKSLPLEWVYRSGCLSFASNEKPSIEEQTEIINSFENFAAAGAFSNVRFDWVRAKKKGRLVLSFATARAHLEKGKSLNIAPPGYKKDYDVWRDFINAKFFHHQTKTSIGTLRAKLEEVTAKRQQYNESRYGPDDREPFDVELFSGT
ncbi:hypothetical protein [Thioclava sp. GXIMD2076]|uniref:hypothetical protein n=1 Tax=Thioclava sp. GXIMD2076 TaxID=3131931 RepID=UPI0030CE0B4D